MFLSFVSVLVVILIIRMILEPYFWKQYFLGTILGLSDWIPGYDLAQIVEPHEASVYLYTNG
jgi:hypothetical protein